jgi:hypothetical protein
VNDHTLDRMSAQRRNLYVRNKMLHYILSVFCNIHKPTVYVVCISPISVIIVILYVCSYLKLQFTITNTRVVCFTLQQSKSTDQDAPN